MALLYATIGSLFLMAFSMIVTLVASLKSRITQLMKENSRLFDKMHEGLVIVAKKNLNPSFSNKPATALFKNESVVDG